MAEKYVSFRMGKETSLGSEVAPSNNNPFMDGTFVFAYNDKYNHFDSSDQIVDGRLYIDATIDNNNYRFPINSECSYFLINKEDGTDFAVGDENSPIYFANGIPQIIECIKTQVGGTGLTSFTANRMMWSSSASALTTSAHYVDSTHLGVNYTSVPNYNLYVNGTTGFANGHIYLTGAQSDNFTNNTTQIIFGTPNDNHLAISSKNNAFILSANSTSTTGQIILNLDAQSTFPKGIKVTGGDIDITGSLNASNDSTFGANVEIGNNLTVQSNLIVNTDANIAGNTTMAGTLTVTKDTILEADLSVGGDSTIKGSQTIETDLTVFGNAEITGTLDVTDAVTFDSTLDVADAVTFDSTLLVNDNITAKADVSIEGNLDVSGAASITKSLEVGEDASITKNLAVKKNLDVDGTTTLGNVVTLDGEDDYRKITTPSGKNLYISPGSTLYLESGANSSLIFCPQGTEQGRFNTSGQLQIKSTGAANATVIGPDTAGTFYFPNTGGTFVTHATRGTNVGSASLPVYIATTGRATACTASSVFSDFSSSANTLSITVATQTRTASIVNSISNTWGAGTASKGPSLSTTVNGVTGTAVRIPVATNLVCGATKVWKAADCTEYSDDTYALTCAAVKKAFGSFDKYHTRAYSSGLKISTGTNVSDMYVPNATASQAGVVSTAAQTFAGLKTFNNSLVCQDTLYLRDSALVKGTAPSESTGTYITFSDSQGTAAKYRTGMIYSYVDSSNITHMRMYAYRPLADSTTSSYLDLMHTNGNSTYATYSGGYFQVKRLIATSTTDAAYNSANGVALITGDASGTHLEFDGNEIFAKTNGTTAGTLYIQSGSGSVEIGSGGTTTIGTKATFKNDAAGGFNFAGRIDVGCLLLTNTGWTGYGTGDPSGLTAVTGRVYFKIV